MLDYVSLPEGKTLIISILGFASGMLRGGMPHKGATLHDLYAQCQGRIN